VVVTAHRIVRGGPAEPKVLKNKAKRSHLSDEAKKKRRSPEIPPLPARDAQQRHGLCRVFKKTPPKKPCISAIGTVAVGTGHLIARLPKQRLPSLSLSSSGLARIHSHAQLVLFFFCFTRVCLFALMRRHLNLHCGTRFDSEPVWLAQVLMHQHYTSTTTC
jgi:hypothetical protein